MISRSEDVISWRKIIEGMLADEKPVMRISLRYLSAAVIRWGPATAR